jgi:hypothetical protein
MRMAVMPIQQHTGQRRVKMWTKSRSLKAVNYITLEI